MKPNRATWIDYYTGAYGPTVRIDAVEDGDLGKMRALFGALANGSLKEAELLSEIGVDATTVARIVLTGGETARERSLILTESQGDRVAFHWCLEPKRWSVQAEKVEALMANRRPGHQYLTAEGVDDALVELCYLERPSLRAGPS